MANMSATKLPMPEQDPAVRSRNFEEVEMCIRDSAELEQCENTASRQQPEQSLSGVTRTPGDVPP